MKIPGFTIERLIAKGGTASVYLATQDALGRTVALKVLDKLDDAEQSARFLAEGRIIAGLNHRNINTLYDVGRSGTHHYLAMEYLEGGSLTERIQKGVRLSSALDILESMATCLGFLHGRGIIHRDVKPGNILFHADGTPKLTDFGIAKQLESDQQHTLDGTALGSPYYLSPEQATGQAIDGRADIYSLGIVFYEMLTGNKPYQEDSHVQTIVAHLNQPAPVLPTHLAHYQPLLERMVAKDPEERFSSAAELLGFIRGLRLSRPDRQPSPWQNPRTAAAAVAVLLLALAGGVLLWPSSEPPISDAGVAEQPAASTPVQQHTEQQPAPSQAPVQQPPAASAQATPPANQDSTSQPPLDDWLAAAQRAVRDNRLTFPEEDSALYYYNRILAESPDHVQAKAGIAQLAERYYDMATRAQGQGQRDRARRYTQRGLNIDPKHAGLLRLSKQIPADDSPWSDGGNAVDNSVNSVKAWWKRNFD